MESIKKISAFGYSNQQVEYNNESLDDEDYDNHTIQSFSSEKCLQSKPDISFKNVLQKLLLSNKYQVLIITLVVLDTLIVISELLLDLEFPNSHSQAPEILHCISISLLSLFVLEILLKIYAFRSQFFTSKGDMFDAVIVITALILDSISLHSIDAFGAVGLVIVLRLWRVVRIQNSMVVSVHKRGEKKLLNERDTRIRLQADLELERERHTITKQCCHELLQLIKQHNISLPSSIILKLN